MFRRVLVVAALALSACASSGDGATVRSADAIASANARPDTGTDIVTSTATVTSTSTVASTSVSTDTGDSQVGGGDVIRLSPAECSIALRTLETAIEAYYAEHTVDITSADDLITAGYVLELFEEFDIDVSVDIPRPFAVIGGPCDYDFRADFATERATEAEAADRRGCWMDLIAAEVAARGYTVAVGAAPTSFEEIASVYDVVPTEWSTVALSPDGQIVDLVPGGCTIGDAAGVFGPEWIGAAPECGVDAWTLGWALYLSGGQDVAGFGLDRLISDGLVLPHEYRYAVTDGALADIVGSDCPSVTTDESDDTADEDSHACRVEQRTLETAAEAFFATFQRSPVSIDELVDAEFLLDGTDHWVLTTAPAATTSDADSLSFEPVPGGRCDPAT